MTTFNENLVGSTTRKYVSNGDAFDQYAKTGRIVRMTKKRDGRLVVSLNGGAEQPFDLALVQVRAFLNI